MFVGPFLSAAIITLTGHAAFAFWIAVGTSIAAAIILLALPDPETTFGAVRTIRIGHRELTDGEAEAELETVGLFRTIKSNAGVLLRVGTGRHWSTPSVPAGR